MSDNIVDQPRAGFFKMRLHKDAWSQVPVRICHEDGYWLAEIDGEPAGPPEKDPSYAKGVLRIWHGRKEEISETEYRHRVGPLKDWAKAHYPDHPLLHIEEPVRVGTLRPIPAFTAPTAPERQSEEPLNAPSRPRPMTAAEIVEWLDYENEPLVKSIEHDISQLRDDADVVIEDDQTLSRVAANVSIARAHIRQTEKTRGDQQKPFRDANSTVLKWFQGLTGSLETALGPVQTQMNVYGNKKEAERRAEAEKVAAAARAEAERLAAEAEAAMRKNAPMADAKLDAASQAAQTAAKADALASGKAADLTRSHTDYGGAVSGQETWGWEIVDISKIPLRFLQVNETLMNKEVRDWVRAHIEEARAGVSPNPGIKITRSIAMRTR